MPSRSLTQSEIDAIKSNLDNARDLCLFVLGYRTGFRISELLSLTVGDVGTDTITVKRCNMKGKHSSRTVPLHDEAKAVIQTLLNKDFKRGRVPSDTLLFPINRFQAHRIIRNAVERAGIKGKVSSHSMRKTFGQRVYNATDKNIVAAQRALGHKSLSSTTYYLEVGKEIVDKAILEEK